MLEGGQYTHQSYPLEQPLISVVTVCRNAGWILEQCLESVANQHFNGIEHIIIDGASTDHTLEVLMAHDKTLAYWRSEEDSGIYQAMNKALDHVKGKWVVFLGADDRLLPDFSLLVSSLKNEQTLYYSNVLYDDLPVGRKINGYFLAKNNLCHQSIIYPRAVFEKYRFEDGYSLYADHHLNMRCWSDPGFNFEYCDLLTARFATDGASSRKEDVRFMKDKARLIKIHFGYVTYWRYLFKEWKSKIRK